MMFLTLVAQNQRWALSVADLQYDYLCPVFKKDVLSLQICCQFDFRRLPGGGVTCPWRIAPQQIDVNNVAQRY